MHIRQAKNFPGGSVARSPRRRSCGLASRFTHGTVAGDLTAMGALIEWSSRNLVPVDAVGQEHAQKVADFLAEREKAG
jgi:hypothetical protein